MIRYFSIGKCGWFRTGLYYDDQLIAKYWNSYLAVAVMTWLNSCLAYDQELVAMERVLEAKNSILAGRKATPASYRY